MPTVRQVLAVKLGTASAVVVALRASGLILSRVTTAQEVRMVALGKHMILVPCVEPTAVTTCAEHPVSVAAMKGRPTALKVSDLSAVTNAHMLEWSIFVTNSAPRVK